MNLLKKSQQALWIHQRNEGVLKLLVLFFLFWGKLGISTLSALVAYDRLNAWTKVSGQEQTVLSHLRKSYKCTSNVLLELSVTNDDFLRNSHHLCIHLSIPTASQWQCFCGRFSWPAAQIGSYRIRNGQVRNT